MGQLPAEIGLRLHGTNALLGEALPDLRQVEQLGLAELDTVEDDAPRLRRLAEPWRCPMRLSMLLPRVESGGARRMFSAILRKGSGSRPGG
jgi:hypothetical protein